jgi:hypothetical protein
LNLFGRQDEPISRLQLDRLFGKLADPDLGPGQVGHNRHPLPGGSGSPANIFNHLFMAGEITVGKIDPGHIQARLDHLPQDFDGLRSGADGAYDFGLVNGKLHNQGSPL